MVYFISDGDYIKIGKATDVDKRLKGLQTGSSRKLFKSHILDGGYELESRLHIIFNKYRFFGEWFDLPSYYLNISADDVNEIYDSFIFKKPKEKSLLPINEIRRLKKIAYGRVIHVSALITIHESHPLIKIRKSMLIKNTKKASELIKRFPSIYNDDDLMKLYRLECENEQADIDYAEELAFFEGLKEANKLNK